MDTAKKIARYECFLQLFEQVLDITEILEIKMIMIILMIMMILMIKIKMILMIKIKMFTFHQGCIDFLDARGRK